MEELRQKQEAGRKKLEEMKLAGGKAWEDLKSGMDRITALSFRRRFPPGERGRRSKRGATCSGDIFFIL
jgi:hypothetical protein